MSLARLAPVLLVAACAGEPAPTWSDDVRSIYAANCTGCHVTGGSAPFPLETFDDARQTATLALWAVESGAMPPWMPDPDCRPLEGARLMSDDDVATLRAWVEADTPEGAPTEPIAVDRQEIEPDLVMAPSEPYTPDPTSDDYRCFPLEQEFDEDAFLTAVQVTPGSPAVHHVLVYAVTGAQIDLMAQADADDDGPGYTCFGGPIPTTSAPDQGGFGATTAASTGFPNQIGTWVPGMQPERLPDDTAIRIEAGSRVIVQVHYGVVGGEAVPDRTRVEVALADTPPARLSQTRPLAIPDFEIPAGEPDARFTRTFTNHNDHPVTIRGFLGHMHKLGKSQHATVVRADGTGECAFDVPSWDFDWQQGYTLAEPDWITLAPGDGIEMTCAFDNSAGNQPVVDGAQQAPRDVTWGEGTADEMCLLYVSLVDELVPTEPSDDLGVCAASGDCLADCADGTVACLTACEETRLPCVGCTLQAARSCGGASCAVSLLGARDCLLDCGLSALAFDSPMGPCLDATCADEIDALASCLDPILDTEACDEALSACGVGG